MYVVVVLLVALTYEHIESKPSLLKYTWMPDSAQFDYMVGISYKNLPVCSGVLGHTKRVLTAATPLRYYKLKHYHITGFPLYVHVIYREWDKSVAIKVTHIYYQSIQFNYSTIDFDRAGIYEPVHDLAYLTLEKELPTSAAALAVRHPIMLKREFSVYLKPSGVFTIAGHGYADRLHVQQNIQLEAVDYLVQDVLVDCDEWVPRAWGYFVCLLNVDNFVGISSGAVLLHDGKFIGVGSFSLRRGDETILLFTDLNKYKLLIYFLDRSKLIYEPMWA